MGSNDQAQQPQTGGDSAEEQLAIIASLCAGAPTDTVRNCLRKYDPAKTSYQIERELKKDKKEVLVDALGYLGIPDMNQYRADTLPHELVCTIQNLLPDSCHLCKQSFCVKLGEKPILSCVRCGQGCHNSCVLQLIGKTEEDLNQGNNFGADLANPYSSLGLFYLCHYCQEEAIPQRVGLKVKQSSRRNSTTTQQTTSPSRTQTQADQNSVNSQSDTTAAAIVPNVTILERNTQSAPEDQSPTNEQRQINQQRPENTPPICKNYRTGRCKHGISGKKDGICPYTHPKACSKFMGNGTRRSGGCTRGKNCKFFHPSICHSSMKEKKCFRENCKFMHLKGTNRELQSEDDPSRHNSRIPAEDRNTPDIRKRNWPAPGVDIRPNNSSSNMETSFLDQMKVMQDQMSQIASRLQLIDTNYQHLCLQQQGYPLSLRYPVPPPVGKQMINHPQMGQQMAFPYQAMCSNPSLQTSH